MNYLDHIGRGESYPFTADQNSKVLLVDGFKLVEQSMRDILATPLGSRPFQEDYGSMLHTLNFEQNDAILGNLAKTYSVEAIRNWEKRALIYTKDVTIEISEAKCNIFIPYLLLATNETHSFIYPFYRALTS
ncbi:MAG: hypothetical protein EKK63_12680 [Acinetobacter sp.]|uniref:GPW/gp25 family protein n=1 Tax=Acinetobacter sp. TaxID=472 RepID=UPI000F9AEB92|nr:GPW/gp25 family protein [Acinetobacter sp.]RUP38229.1 MAG: hypothetical protein EKK63_12680 [Acinetobacter sp.]